MRPLLISLPYPVCQRMAVYFIIQTTQITLRLLRIEPYILLFYRGTPFLRVGYDDRPDLKLRRKIWSGVVSAELYAYGRTAPITPAAPSRV
jgi:hypothetical protein